MFYPPPVRTSAAGTSAAGSIRWATLPSKCLDVQDGNTRNGANVMMYDCEANNPNQQFILPMPDGPIVWATHPTKCMDVWGGSIANGNNLAMGDCEDFANPNQQFRVHPE